LILGDWIKPGGKQLSGWRLFSGKYEEVAYLLNKAGISFELSKNNDPIATLLHSFCRFVQPGFSSLKRSHQFGDIILFASC